MFFFFFSECNNDRKSKTEQNKQQRMDSSSSFLDDRYFRILKLQTYAARVFNHTISQTIGII